MEQTLLLNATFEPLKIVDWQKAMCLWARGRVEILERHDREVRAVTFSFKLPSVVRLLRFVRVRRREKVAFTRANIYARDQRTCQYCGQQFATEDLTFDHVIPAAQGGARSWDNIVTACEPCNRRKADRTPSEAQMTLLRKPRRPMVLAPTAKLTVGWRTPANWHSWLYWNVALEQK